MKKLLLTTLMGLSLISTSVFAAPRGDCSFSPLQQVIRNAREPGDITKLIEDKVNLNIKPRCGGNVLQLATLRGNVNIFTTLLQSGNLPLDEKVSNSDYPIPGAPKEIPLGFFIAYYAPSANIMQSFINSGANLLITDDRGETILWYLNQNPVLMNTEITDFMMRQLLLSNTSTGQADANQDVKKNDKNKKEAKKATRSKRSSDDEEGDLIEAEPDNPYKRQAADGMEEF